MSSGHRGHHHGPHHHHRNLKSKPNLNKAGALLERAMGSIARMRTAADDDAAAERANARGRPGRASAGLAFHRLPPQDEHKERRELLAQALHFNPHLTEARALLALFLAGERKNRNALGDAHDHARRALKADPTLGAAHYARALALDGLDHFDASLHAFDQALLYNSPPGPGALRAARAGVKAHALKTARNPVMARIAEKTPDVMARALEKCSRGAEVALLLSDVDDLLGRETGRAARLARARDAAAKEAAKDKDDKDVATGIQTRLARARDAVAKEAAKDKDEKDVATGIQTPGPPVEHRHDDDLGDDDHDRDHALPHHHPHHRHALAAYNCTEKFGRAPLRLPCVGGLVEYYEGGQHATECRRILVSAKRYLQRVRLLSDMSTRAAAKALADKAKLEELAGNMTKKRGRGKRGRRRRGKKAAAAAAAEAGAEGAVLLNFVAIDIDDTALSSYDFLKRSDFSGPPPVFRSEFLAADPPLSHAAGATLELYNWIKDEEGLCAVFFTHRPAWCKQQTLEALFAAGYEGVGSDAVIFCGAHNPPPAAPNKDKAAAEEKQPQHPHHHDHRRHRKTTAQVTGEALKAFEEDQSHGFQRRIIMIVGDQDSDFPVAAEDKVAARPAPPTAAADSEVLHVKLPNYLYTIA